MEIYYGSNEYANFTASDIENMTLPDLTLVAAEQKKRLYELHPLDKAYQQKQLSEIL